MFTGIITDIGTILSSDQRGDLRLRIDCGYDVDSIAMGASIACSGVCLTVVDKGQLDDNRGWFAVDLSAETLACSAPSMWRTGNMLNLERALKVGDELGGHIVTGHVDGVGTVLAISQQGDSRKIDIQMDASIAPYLASKGSITINGVSLTVNEVADNADGSSRFAINMIPHTAEVTTLGGLTAGDTVNLEIDVLARYLKRMNDFRSV